MEMKIREYEVLGKIGQPGGMAVVYKAKHQSLEVIRAIKKLHFHLSTNTSIIQRFENEAKALSILEHPNIVKVYDFFREEDSYFLIMEFIDGPSLAEVLKKSALKEKKALEYLKQILSTMAFAHDKKILHRDIKPSNILIDKAGVIKVVDFGIAKMMDRKGITSTGFTMGSPWYMSPEQIIGHELDARSDIYSLGITLFEMLTAKVPFNDTSEYKIYEKHQKEPVPSLKEFNKKFSTDLDGIIQRATAKKPEDRYQSAAEFSEAIDIYLALSELGGKAGATIAEFDPSEYLNIDVAKLESHTEFSEDSIAKTKFALTSFAESFDAKTKAGQTQKETKRTSFQQETVFQDDDGTQISPEKTSDLISQKKLTGLHSPKRSIPVKLILSVTGAAAIVFVFVYLVFFVKWSSDYFTVNMGEITYNSVELSWPPTQEAQQYMISRREAGDSVYHALAMPTITDFRDTTVSPAVSYQYQINANETDGTILAIGEISVKTPAVRFDLSVDDISDTEVYLSWNQIENIRDYIIYRRAESEELKEVYRGSENSFTDTKLKPEQSYDYLVKVIFANRNEFESNYLNIITEPARKTKPGLAFGTLDVNSVPGEAKFFMDGKELGTTPFIRKGLKAGNYKIVLKKEGYSDFTQTVRVRGNRRTKIAPELVSLYGIASILVRPYGSIIIDGKLLKKDTPTLYKTELLAGQDKVTVVHTGLGARWEKEVVIQGGTDQRINVDFTKMFTVTVTSQPEGNIIVDGVATGDKTPKTISVRAGQHSIGIRREGYVMVTGSQTVNLEKNLEKPLKFVLREKK